MPTAAEWGSYARVVNPICSLMSLVADTLLLGYLIVKPMGKESGNLMRGYLLQWSVQASDFSTFSLAVVTFIIARSSHEYTILCRRLNQLEEASSFLVISIVTLPIMTAMIGYQIVGMSPGGSWCWFSNKPQPLAIYIRYGLTHGPRIFIIASIIGMYASIFTTLRRRLLSRPPHFSTSHPANTSKHFSSAKHSAVKKSAPAIADEVAANATAADASGGAGAEPGCNVGEGSGARVSDLNMMGDMDLEGTGDATKVTRGSVRGQEEAGMAICRLLVYPTTYTILWIPGLINRFAEAANFSPEVQGATTLFQCTTQLVGFANGCIYGYFLFKRGH
ncbi:hypothetical protein HK101_000971 [Irineochytrium annulatum]|nr:hypothetical protein HK101_000971 [Irineochytrium annulatum]